MDTIKEQEATEKQIEATLKQISDFCKEHGIELTCAGCSCCGEIRIVYQGKVLRNERYKSFELEFGGD